MRNSSHLRVVASTPTPDLAQEIAEIRKMSSATYVPFAVRSPEAILGLGRQRSQGYDSSNVERKADGRIKHISAFRKGGK